MILANFGGPRTLDEVLPFLIDLLLDRDLIRTALPPFFHRTLFTRLAKKRAEKVKEDYRIIGGGSPIFEDTLFLSRELEKRLQIPIIPFHRYLSSTHQDSFAKIEALNESEIRVLPLFPQFSYATTGSIARVFSQNLSCSALRRLRFIKSYPVHPGFISSFQTQIRTFLHDRDLAEEEVGLLFSAHGLPRSFICNGDLYQSEVESSFRALAALFPKAESRLAYQSKFGRGQWLEPSTEQLASSPWGKPHVVVIPISFLSDHIETLFEIEQLYLPLLRAQGLFAYRCPALNRAPFWIDALASIALDPSTLAVQMLVRNPAVCFCCNLNGKDP
jgi:ferrochelatase